MNNARTWELCEYGSFAGANLDRLKFGAQTAIASLSRRQRRGACARGVSTATMPATMPTMDLGFELFELLPDAVVAVDRHGMIRYANRQAGELFRREPETLIMTPVEDLLPEDLRERHIVHRTQYHAQPRMRPMGTCLDLAARRADGATFPVDIMLAPLTHLAEPIVLAVVRDVTSRRSTEKLRLAFEAAQLGWWSYDLGGHAVSGDARFKEIFDVSVDEMPVEDLKNLVHPDDAERFLADREASINPADPQRAAHEYRVMRRDGEVRWVEVRRLVHFEGTGRERRPSIVVGVVRDVTERKRNEEQTQLLIREANHRTKNMLSVVDAIARQTATTNPNVFLERFSQRIQALSAIQDLLTRSEWQGIEADDLVRAQLMPYADLIGSRIVIHDPKLRLNAACAQAIGLALHELATNAAKYGALSTDKGRVDITWKIDGDTFTMSWTEREGPRVSAPLQRGFGTVVMQMMAERSVNGSIDLDYAPSGLNWRLTCPAANAVEQT